MTTTAKKRGHVDLDGFDYRAIRSEDGKHVIVSLTASTPSRVIGNIAMYLTVEQIDTLHAFAHEQDVDEGPRCPHGVRTHTSCRDCDPTAFMWPDKEIGDLIEVTRAGAQ